MYEYKITYNYTTWEGNPETAHRRQSYDIYEADNAQDAVDQCREDFCPANELKITSVYKKGYYGWEEVFSEFWE